VNSALYKLQYLRRKNGFNQEQMAEKLGMTVHGYRKIEQGTRKLTLEMAMQIKKIVGVTHIEDLLDAG